MNPEFVSVVSPPTISSPMARKAALMSSGGGSRGGQGE
jgi:hypothetical protein